MSYAAGRALEYRVRDLLIASGYLVVRSAGSKGVIDLVALPRIESPAYGALSAPLAVQCKRGGVLPRAEWNKLVTEALSVQCVPVLARWEPHQPIELWRLLGFKDSTRRTQPMVKFEIPLADPLPDTMSPVG